MRKIALSLILSCLLSACAFEATGGSEAGLVVTDRCEISGLGALAVDGAFFSGTVRGGDTGARGSWVHVGSDVVIGEANFIVCRINGALLGDFGGPAMFNGRRGYNYIVGVQDFGDPGPPEVVEGTPEVQTIEATRRYCPSRWEDGALTIEDRALVTIPTELPVTVGNAANQWAWIRFERSETSDIVTCRYQGGSPKPIPRRPSELAAGELYKFRHCTSDLGADDIEPGDRIDVRWLELHVESGARHLPPDGPQTTVTVDFDVTPLLVRERPRDRYRIGVWDNVTSERVFFLESELSAGNITLVQLDD